MFNAKITVQGRITGADDDDGNKTYTYPSLLTDERCRASIAVKSKLTDDQNWITYKIRKFLIKDLNTSLVDATHVVYNSKYYKIDKIEEPESFGRIKHRIIEAEYKEGKA